MRISARLSDLIDPHPPLTEECPELRRMASGSLTERRQRTLDRPDRHRVADEARVQRPRDLAEGHSTRAVDEGARVRGRRDPSDDRDVVLRERRRSVDRHARDPRLAAWKCGAQWHRCCSCLKSTGDNSARAWNSRARAFTTGRDSGAIRTAFGNTWYSRKLSALKLWPDTNRLLPARC